MNCWWWELSEQIFGLFFLSVGKFAIKKIKMWDLRSKLPLSLGKLDGLRDWSRWKIFVRFFYYYYRLRTFEWKIVMGFATFVWKIAVKFVSLYFHLASDVEKRWLGHALSEISTWWDLLKDSKHVPSARSDPTRNKHKDHVVPAGYWINISPIPLY